MPGPAEMKAGAFLTANTNRQEKKSKARNATNANIDQHLFLQMTVYFPPLLLLRLVKARQIQVLTILPTEKLRQREDKKGIKGEKKERTKDETSRKRNRRKKEGNNHMISPFQEGLKPGSTS